MIDQEKLNRLYKLGGGVKSRWGRGRVFYPKKPRSCKNCEFIRFGTFSEYKGCSFFNTIIEDGIQKPKNICIPIKHNNDMTMLHAEDVTEWILRNLWCTDF